MSRNGGPSAAKTVAAAVAAMLVGLLLVVSPVEAGCVAAGFCCDGNNSTCRADGPRMNGVRSRTCFCDSHCLRGRDCCTDYHDACERAAMLAVRVVDCEMGAWEAWSECDARCGQGTKQRRRTVAVEPENGGRPCGPTVEKAVCEGTGCKIPRAPNSHAEHIKETGKIIPAKFGTWRKSKTYDPYMDIRKNLFEHYESIKHIEQPQPYCAHFELTNTRPSCRRSPYEWPKLLVPGVVVCVECQPMITNGQPATSCRGHGVYGRETRWDAVIVPGCHGNWIMRSPHAPCQCPPEDPLSFVLV